MSMKMAKASKADLDGAMTLTNALDCLTGNWPTMPEAVESPGHAAAGEPFDREDPQQCTRALGHLLDLAENTSLTRVVWGCAVVMDPKNRCVDPDADTIEHHPKVLKAWAAQTPRPLSEYHEDHGAVLWWKFPVEEAPWCGTPLDSNWPGDHTHWTPLLVPEAPAPLPA